MTRASVLAALLLCLGCRPPATSPDAGPPDAGIPDAGIPDAGPPDGGLPVLTGCPTTGPGAYTGPGTCLLITPEQSGAASTGENASEPSYAITADPKVAATDTLVLYLNGSGAHPRNFSAPLKNFYAAASSVGRNVLAISYASDTSVGDLCGHDDGCFFPTRQTIVLGVPQSGAAAPVAGLTLDEGVVDRVVLALTTLAQVQPAARWSRYLTTAAPGASPQERIDWSKVVVTGHSQGGGHATVLGKLFAVNRVVQLSSPCDVYETSGPPVTWTSASDGPWASDPSQFYGLAAPSTFTGTMATGGDTTCPYHAANWANLGMVASHQHDDAATCGETGDTHNASIACTDNYPTWVVLLQ